MTTQDAAAASRDQIEEMGVPSYGLEEVGHRRETFANGEFAADLRVDGSDVALTWTRVPDGKPLKSVDLNTKQTAEAGWERSDISAIVRNSERATVPRSSDTSSTTDIRSWWPAAYTRSS